MAPHILAIIFIGGGIGAMIRWLAGRLIGERYHGRFPLATFMINVSGSFLMGFLSILFNVDWVDRVNSGLTAFMLTGVLGGYTTFSSYQLDSANLYNNQNRRLAMVYLVASIVAGLLAASVGAWIARLL